MGTGTDRQTRSWPGPVCLLEKLRAVPSWRPPDLLAPGPPWSLTTMLVSSEGGGAYGWLRGVCGAAEDVVTVRDGEVTELDATIMRFGMEMSERDDTQW